ncbi:hypothetical protein IAU60_003803 [Kwoniella sp. DSM 27419]
MAHLRDAQPLIVHCDTDVIRAIHGVGELFARPTVILRACYAVPSSSKLNQNGDVDVEEETAAAPVSTRYSWLIGEDLVNAEKEEGFQSKYELRWPFRPTSGTEDWDGRAYVLSHLLSIAGLKIPTNFSPLLFVPPPTPPTMPLSTQAAYTQLAFETLNAPLFSLLPSPLASLYALGATTGIVIHVGRYESTIFIVTDSVVRWECSTVVEVGEGDCVEWFERLLMEDEALDQELKAVAENPDLDSEEKRKFVREVAEVVWRECTGDDIEVPFKGGNQNSAMLLPADKEEESFDVAKKLVGDSNPAPAAASHKSKKQQAQAAAAAAKSAAIAAEAAAAAAAAPQPIDAIVVNIPSLPGKEVQLGPVRHRLCEPLLFGKVSGGDTVWEGVGRAVDNASLSLAERMSVWDGIGVVGELARFKSFAPALVTYLSPYLLSSSELTSDCQPGKARLLSIPEYFANFKNATGDLAPFLGASLVSRVAFNDSQGQHAISKVDYNAKGPAAIYNVPAEGQS